MHESCKVDPGFFYGRGAYFRNGVTVWWDKQILKMNTKKKVSKEVHLQDDVSRHGPLPLVQPSIGRNASCNPLQGNARL